MTEVALVHPEIVGAVALIGPVVDPLAPGGIRQAARLLSDLAHETPAASLMQFREWLRCGPRWFAATLPEMLDYRIEERVGGLRLPVAVVRGARDSVSPARFAALLADRVGGATVQVPGAGHLAMVRRPDLVAEVVLGLAE